MKKKVISIVVTVLIGILAIIGMIQIKENNIAKFNSLEDKKESIPTKSEDIKTEDEISENVEIQKENEQESKIESKEEKIDNDVKEETKIDETKKEEVKVVDNSNKQQTKENNSSNKNEVVETPKQTIQNTTTVQKQEEVNESNNNQQQNKTEEVKTEVKQNNPWDDLNITEYEYYNKPAQSWKKVDFSVKSYGTRTATESACRQYGDEYIKTNTGVYWCISVESYSGDYLGEYFDYKENS